MMNENVNYILSRYKKNRVFVAIRNDQIMPPDDIFTGLELAFKDGHFNAAHEMVTYFIMMAEVDSRFPLRADESLAYLKQFSDNGDAYAKDRLAYYHLGGKYLPRNVEAALTLLLENAASNYAPSMYKLGCMYEEGADVEKNSLTAMDWYKKASKLGHHSAKVASRKLKKSLNSL